MESQKKRKVKIIVLLAMIWFVISLPLPWLYKTPEEARPQMMILLQMIGIISIPFVALGIAWTVKPELTT